MKPLRVATYSAWDKYKYEISSGSNHIDGIDVQASGTRYNKGHP